MTTMKITAVLGDVSGHLGVFVDALRSLGVDLDDGPAPRLRRWPDDLYVVQVGDLVHKGPQSVECAALGLNLATQLPGRYVQLVGNHEGQYLGGPSFFGDVHASFLADMLRRADRSGVLHAACWIDPGDDLGPDVLVSHAGLTTGIHATLGHPDHPSDAAAALNSAWVSDRPWMQQAGMMLGDHVTEPNVLWADGYVELLRPWLARARTGRHVPFSQVHGHSSVRFHGAGRIPADVRAHAHLTDLGHEITRLGGQFIAGVDPGNGKRVHRPLRPFLVAGRPHVG